ncbi:hypothetical protein H6F53_13290 [Trichocoleus sp. FACHB-832]|uniref:hypothetical protein n=1 Tax=Trichocoleus sp. FACHB-832 TaxID=2692875 RepID=UPI0016871D1E|nr:hypothetical protein [Trichocoleus sp. FACHB-832]MBD1906452.1 hypothetical protein [Trichocoleus sp. FACHB-832]
MPVSNPLEIAALVRETRFRLGLTQAQFAEKLGFRFNRVLGKPADVLRETKVKLFAA